MMPLRLIGVVWMLVCLHLARLRYLYLAALAVGILAALLVAYVFFLPPTRFPTGTPIIIAPGTSVVHAAALLREGGYIRSTFLFRALYRVLPGTHGVMAGTFVFLQPSGELTVAWNLAHGIAGVPTVKLTFPEGTPVRQMGDALAAKIPGFDGEKFKSIALPAEGYLFPDTYFFLPSATPQSVMDTMRGNFDAHMKAYQQQLTASGHTLHDVIIMASLLESEGKTLEDRRVIAGILWKRLSIGMPLQVDATFGYIYGKTGYAPSAADLKDNSAYNTYRYKGLPPTPINNPGDESILAALTPTKTDFLYYLTGDDGQMHYAKTLAEHAANQKKYLK